jgi:hypothetical protein
VDPSVQRALVVGRLLGVATTVLALGSGAHVLGGGHAPSGAALALIGALVLAGSAALARRPLTVRVLLPAAVVGQLAVHVALTWLAPSGAAAMAGGVHAGDARLVGHPGHPELLAGSPGLAGVPAAAASSALGGADPVSGAAVADPHGAGGPMLLAHALAMAATVLLLVATDRGLVALAGRWAALLPALTGGLPGPVPARPRPVAPGLPAPRPLPALRGGAARRGPPAELRPRVA